MEVIVAVRSQTAEDAHRAARTPVVGTRGHSIGRLVYLPIVPADAVDVGRRCNAELRLVVEIIHRAVRVRARSHPGSAGPGRYFKDVDLVAVGRRTNGGNYLRLAVAIDVSNCQPVRLTRGIGAAGREIRG